MAGAWFAPSRMADAPRPDGYLRRRPEESVLYQIVSAHWPDFRQKADDAGGLPRFVVREFEEYLRCGLIEHGLVRLACQRCGHEIVVAFSCKSRAWCPSCCGRRMADAAAHLVERVIPPVGMRQWVCTLPWPIRSAVAFDRRLCSDVLAAFAGALLHHLRLQAKRTFGLTSAREAHVGAITFIQRCDGSLRLNPHFHTLATDGVWLPDDRGELRFRPLPDPTPEQVAELARRVHARLTRVLAQHGRLGEELAAEQAALASCVGASAGDLQLLGAQAGRRTAKRPGPAPDPVGICVPVAECGGVNIHAGTAVDGRDRRRLERLVRYMSRPPICTERLELLEDGRVYYGFKSAWRDGSKGVILHPLDFIARLCALVPPPRFHMQRYHGLFASGSPHRGQIVPSPGPATPVQARLPLAASDPATGLPPERPATPSRHPWANLLKRAFLIEVSICPKRRCGGRMHVVEFATGGEHLARALAALGLGPRPPDRGVRIPARQLAFPLEIANRPARPGNHQPWESPAKFGPNLARP
ncbi:MAG: transposase [Actinobacteria bacterium]|nr:transposase [Actinomycetota bacterium]